MADGPAKSGATHRIYYYATPFAGANGAAVLTEVGAGGVQFDDIISDVKLADSRSGAELNERGRDVTLELVGGRTVMLTGKITCRPGNTVYDALAAAYAANTVIGILVTDGNKATAGTRCVAFNCQIKEWSQDQPDPGAATHDFSVSPTALSTFALTSVTVT